MPEITAAAVKALRDRTNLPMMDCKRALEQSGGDAEKAIELLRKAGKKTQESKTGRVTSFGRMAIFAGLDPAVGAMVELRCESASVVANEGFVQLANDAARQLAAGLGAATPDELLAQPSPSQPGQTLREQLDHLFNRIREVFRVGRIVRIDGPCAGYVHHTGGVGVLLEVGGKADPVLARDICMHIAAIRPKVVSPAELDPAAVEKEREILREAARKEGKPEKIIEKMVEGRLRDFYAQHCLAEQPFVKDSAKTVGKVAQEAGMKLVRFIHWELGEE
jgi:elongation factor Ts